MYQPKFWTRSALLLLVSMELWLFTGSFHKYFNLDSAFYVIQPPRTWGELRQTFSAPDVGRQYRPLTLALMALVVPVFQQDPRPYHWIPIVFHVVNTLLFYSLARRILRGEVAPLAAAAFWGLHSVAGWITYDTTCLPDFLLVFFLLLCLILASDGSLRNSRLLTAGSLLFFILALLTKEAAVTLPLALLICLVLVQLRSLERDPTWPDLREATGKALPFTGTCLAIALVYAGFLAHWLRAGLIYTQGRGAAYDLNPSVNWLAKAKYLFWALNFPDRLHIPGGPGVRRLALLLLGILLACLLAEFLRRKGRMEAAGWAGLLWLVGTGAPYLMLSSRVAKWYLYVPLLGLALTLGTLAQSLCNGLKTRRVPLAAPIMLVLVAAPMMYSSRAQNKSYLAFSDASFASDIIESFYSELRTAYSARPPQATVLLLPSFEPEITTILSSPPVNSGRLLELDLGGRRVEMLFAHEGARLSDEQRRDPNVRIFHNLYGRFHDVTEFYKSGGGMTIYVLPTAEGKSPPLLKKNPAGGRALYESHVRLLIGDEGERLPVDYATRRDLWILQYLDGSFFDVTDHFKGTGDDELALLPTFGGKIPPLPHLKRDLDRLQLDRRWRVRLMSPKEPDGIDEDCLRRPKTHVLQYIGGHFTDVTDYYRGRRNDASRRLALNVDKLHPSVSRNEYYPNYDIFATPSGAPVFFSTPQKEILTQIGGSTATIPMGIIPPGASLRFDVSWMYDLGDGGWAEMRLRAGGNETTLFRQFMRPNPKGEGLTWKEVSVDLRRFQGHRADLVLRCYNDTGSNTIADWLNWRDIALELPPSFPAATGNP